MAKNLIGENWVDSSNGKTIEILNPATNQLIDTVPDPSKEDCDAAVEAAVKGQKVWAEKSIVERANVLMKLCQKFNVSVDYLLGLTDIPDTIDDYIAKQKKTGTQPTADEYSADERKIIDMYRQLSEKDKGKIEGRLEEMLDDEQATTKGA